MEHLIPQLSIFILACFVGYYVVWSVTPALHTPLIGGDQRDLERDHRRRVDRGVGGARRVGDFQMARAARGGAGQRQHLRTASR